jgi:hypothetical protein
VRAHYFAPIQDALGNLQAGSTVSVFVNGTTQLVSDPIFSDDSSSTVLGNPFITSTGNIDIYLANPQRVDIGVAPPGQAQTIFPDIDVNEISLSDGGGGGGSGTPINLAFPGSGTSSTQLGNNATATQNESVAYGDTATASGQQSTAAGQGAAATATQATAYGQDAGAAGAQSSAFGASAAAAQQGDLALGSSAVANGGAATALGTGSSAGANDALALGAGAVASGKGAAAIGAGASSATANQITIGTASSTVVIPGSLSATLVSSPVTGSVTNMPAALGTGADDVPNLQAAITAIANASPNGFGGKAYFGSGTYSIQSKLTIPHSMVVEGAGASTIFEVSNAGTIYMHDNTAAHSTNRSQNLPGVLRDFLVEGINATSSSTIGLDVGDGWGFLLEHLFIQNFSVAGMIGLRIANDQYYTEKMRTIDITLRNNATQVYMGANNANNDISHGYCDLEFTFYVLPDQTTFSGGTVGQNGLVVDQGVNLYACKLTIFGNHQMTTNSINPNVGIIVIKGNNGSSYSDINWCNFNIQMEGDGGGGGNISIPKIYFGSTSNSISDSYGIIRISGASAATGSVVVPGLTYAQIPVGIIQFTGIMTDTGMLGVRQSAPDWHN